MSPDKAENVGRPTILVVGCGLVGQEYCRCFRAIGARVVAVCDPDSAKRRLATEICGGTGYASHLDALSSADPDIVCVCAPTAWHYAIVMDAASAGCHVFLEKPMAESVGQAEEMVAAMAESGKSLGYGLKMRFEAVFREAHDRIRSGEIGTPGEVTVMYNQNLPPPDRSWYLKEGVLLGSMPHPFDLSNWLLCQAPEWIWAETARRLGFEGEDRALTVLGYPDGQRAILQMAYQSAFPEVAAEDDMVFQVVGEEGYLLGERSGSLLSVTANGRKRLRVPPVNAFELELRAFLSSICDNRPPPVDGTTGLLVQRMITAAARSAITGRRMKIE